MRNNIFVFRIAKGNGSGKPIGCCPLDYSETKKNIAKLTPKDIKKINHKTNNHIKFIHDELFENNVLRQGWGIPDLDLNLPTHDWIKTYMHNGKIYWDADIECEIAKGRWNIIHRMIDMKEDDVIIIPKKSKIFNAKNNHNNFLICQVVGLYYFDCPSQINDFGHCIKVKNIQEFSYGEDTLLRSDFSAPYLYAITQATDTHSRHTKFLNFIDNTYL